MGSGTAEITAAEWVFLQRTLAAVTRLLCILLLEDSLSSHFRNPSQGHPLAFLATQCTWEASGSQQFSQTLRAKQVLASVLFPQGHMPPKGP